MTARVRAALLGFVGSVAAIYRHGDSWTNAGTFSVHVGPGDVERLRAAEEKRARKRRRRLEHERLRLEGLRKA